MDHHGAVECAKGARAAYAYWELQSICSGRKGLIDVSVGQRTIGNEQQDKAYKD